MTSEVRFETVRGRPRRPLPAPPLGFVPAVWSAAWVSLFAFGDWQVALPMALLTGPVSALGWRWRRSARQQRKAWREPVEPVQPPRVLPVAAPERRIAASLVRAEAGAARLDADALALVRELVGLLTPLVVRVRERQADAAVRHDVEAIAADHLPAVLDSYLSLPTAQQHAAGPDGTTPADRLRGQLLLLVEGCRELGEALLHADLAHQQQLGRFLDAKFRRSDLTA